ncbi:MAG: histidine phosphatase family protein [Alphaproteobacteria bacterium]|nr:histidine phosphatase family protein [Alphaproteobacteria bacterium]
MTALVLVRHGPTAWNELGRVQGSGDVPLSETGRAEVRRWRLPPEFAGYGRVTSPLCRATETAALLGLHDARRDPRLVEMNWGAWEGQHLDELRRELGDLMKAWEAKGLDFKAPGGESPREVQARLRPFLAECAVGGTATLAVAHKGVIRAVYALAVRWDMTGPPPHKLRDGCAHQFVLASDGTPSVARLNIALCEDAAP